jgi:bleomycin hydrolase
MSPYYESTLMMVPDNWSLQSVYNVPMNELTEIVDNALTKWIYRCLGYRRERKRI